MKKNKADVFQPSGDVRRVQPLGPGWRKPGAGRWVRVGDHRGKWQQLSADDNEAGLMALVDFVSEANRDLAVRIVAELQALDPDGFDFLEVPAEP